MGGVRRGRSSPAAPKGANSCGAGPQGLTFSSAPRPRGTYELSVEREETEVQGSGCEVEAAALERDGAALVPDDLAEGRRVRVFGDRLAAGAEVVYRHEPRETRCLRCADRPRTRGVSPVDPVGAQAAGGARSVSNRVRPRVTWTGGVLPRKRPRSSVPSATDMDQWGSGGGSRTDVVSAGGPHAGGILSERRA